MTIITAYLASLIIMISLNQSEPQCIFWSTVSKPGNEINFNNKSLSVAPLSVTISNKLRKLLAGKEYSFTCLSQGFSPTVEFLWFLEDTNMPHPSLQQVVRHFFLLQNSYFSLRKEKFHSCNSDHLLKITGRHCDARHSTQSCHFNPYRTP